MHLGRCNYSAIVSRFLQFLPDKQIERELTNSSISAACFLHVVLPQTTQKSSDQIHIAPQTVVFGNYLIRIELANALFVICPLYQ